ncbi:MAG: T9SS type A sorting domain-containing protein, partial [Bacteroidota bacterium]
TMGDPSIFVDLPESGEFPNGSAFSFPVILGSEDRGVESVYGIAFTIQYNPEVLDPNTLKLTIPDSWLGDIEDLLIIQRHYPERGFLEVAISRKDGVPITGSGAIALMTTIIADVAGFSAIEIGVKKVRGIRTDGSLISINPESRIAKITGNTTATDNWEASGLSIYPNPINDVLRLEHNSDTRIERIEILNPQGQVMKVFIRPSSTILLSDLPLGLYLLKAQIDDHFYHTQIIKQ